MKIFNFGHFATFSKQCCEGFFSWIPNQFFLSSVIHHFLFEDEGTTLNSTKFSSFKVCFANLKKGIIG
jgi:hypothetical protein